METQDGLFPEKLVNTRHCLGAHYDKEKGELRIDIEREPELPTVVLRGVAITKFLHLLDLDLCASSFELIDEKKMREFKQDFRGRAWSLRRSIKFIFDSENNVVSVTSDRHTQVRYSEVDEIIGNAIRVVFGVVNPWIGDYKAHLYSIPVESKYVENFIAIWVGNNLALRRSAIRIFLVFRTKFSRRAPACLNWGWWRLPFQWFGIKGDELDPTGLLRDAAFSWKIIHLKGVKKRLVLACIEALKKLRATAKLVDPLIEEALITSLTRFEIETIIDSYGKRKGFPRHLISRIKSWALDVEEHNLFGLSQAFSQTRTHYDRVATSYERPLELIAGELLLLSPAIKRLKEVVGEITPGVLGVEA